MELPSKKLLSEVLGLAIHNYKLVLQTSIIKFTFDAIGEIRDSSINIYELAHKCKDWAFKEGFEIDSNFSGWYRMSKLGDDGFFYVILDGEKENEIDAIDHCCQWILDNKYSK